MGAEAHIKPYPPSECIICSVLYYSQCFETLKVAAVLCLSFSFFPFVLLPPFTFPLFVAVVLVHTNANILVFFPFWESHVLLA